MANSADTEAACGESSTSSTWSDVTRRRCERMRHRAETFCRGNGRTMSTQATRNALWAAGLMLLFTLTASAHHSFAGQFDPTATMEIEGELIEIRWANPHGLLKVRTVDKGKVVVWELETAGASQMVRSGVEREYLVVGDKVRVSGWPPITAKREMHATNLLTSSGRELILFRGATPKFASGATGNYDYARKREGDKSLPP